MLKKILWFSAFVATGTGLLLISLPTVNVRTNQIALITIGVLFFIGITEHFRELQGRR